MRVSSIQANGLTYNNAQKNISASRQGAGAEGLSESRNYASVPVGFKYGANIHFGEFFDPNRKVPHIDYEEYMAMSPARKKFFRRKYMEFPKGANLDELFDPHNMKMPLRDESTMDAFIKTAQIYSKYKDQPIICLGRSPKWFLNASLWMKDGIQDYKFVAFSGFWYDSANRMAKVKDNVPTEKEENAYRRYLKRIKADPKSIVDTMEKTGKKTVITDYLMTAKGAMSFLDVMSRYANDLGVLEKFSKSIEIVGVGSMEHLAEKNPFNESISEPRVPMPELLRPYRQNIKQTFYNLDQITYYPVEIKDGQPMWRPPRVDNRMYMEILRNDNTNECRSTYYPHQMWTKYQPDRFKIGLLKEKDTKKLREMLAEAKGPKQVLAHFTPTMFDFRNLLNFHILDELNKRGLLKAVHKSKI